MAAAAILALEAFRDAQRRTAVRPRRHDRLDAWLKPLEARMEDRTPPLAELTQAILALRQELTQAVTEGVVEQAHRAALARVCDGEVHGVIWGLQRMPPTDAPAAQAIAQLITALQRHQERLDAR
jgi:hypothetical protein